MITNNTNSFKTNVIMFFFLIAKDEFVHPISELGPSSAGPLFLPAREARGQERSSKTIKLEAPAARSAAGVSTGRLRRPDRSGQF
jgi:hypothetical protein